MPSPLAELPDAFVEATAAGSQSRREKLQRRGRNQRIRTRIALGLSGCVALFALTAYLIGDYAAARSCAMIACTVFAFTCIASAAARKKIADDLREMDRPA
jgi:hypothetical protein